MLQSRPARLQELGRHIIVGYRDHARVKQLVSKGAVGGIYITARNVAGGSAEDIQKEIHSLQAMQRSQGLPRLWIAADQEGGIVSRLSPPLPRQLALSAVIRQCREMPEFDNAVIRYAEKQAKGLAELGVNINLSPVADLKNRQTDHPVNIKSQIFTRAISNNPVITARAVSLYCRVMEKYGINPTLKHFPGLGRVSEETHIVPGQLDAAIRDLEKTDWLPFRQAVRETKAFMMLGHVRLNQVDPDAPASFSEKVVQTIIRKKWGHDGVLITDDLNMGPAYGSDGGIGQAAVKALNAGVDLLLISYDGEQYYKVMDALLHADRNGQLNRQRIAQSRRRLQKTRLYNENAGCL